MYDIQVYRSLVFSVAVESAVSFEPRCWSVVCPWTGPHVTLSNQQHHRHRWRVVSGQAIPWPLRGCSYIAKKGGKQWNISEPNSKKSHTTKTKQQLALLEKIKSQESLLQEGNNQKFSQVAMAADPLRHAVCKQVVPLVSQASKLAPSLTSHRTPARFRLAENKRSKRSTSFLGWETIGKLLRKETWTYLIRTCWACWVSQVDTKTALTELKLTRFAGKTQFLNGFTEHSSCWITCSSFIQQLILNSVVHSSFGANTTFTTKEFAAFIPHVWRSWRIPWPFSLWSWPHVHFGM